MIRIPGMPEWIDTGDARREDKLNKDSSINTSPLDNRDRGLYDRKSCGGHERSLGLSSKELRLISEICVVYI